MNAKPKPDDGVRPFTLLIAALGGEGGGLLTDWIVAACRSQDLLIQTTSIPGVAQRTGATTYYIEMMKPDTAPGREPLFGLYPAPGYVDMAVASEIVEAGRLIEMGFVTPDRTTLIASTHRVFAMVERTALGDGAFEVTRITDAAGALASKLLLNDFAALARHERSALNAVLLGAIAGSGASPLTSRAFETAIRERGVSVEANLRGFEAGKALARGEIEAPQVSAPGGDVDPTGPAALHARADEFAPAARDVIHAGVDRLIDYQDAAYVGLFLDRLLPVAGADDSENHRLTRQTARYLALWMAYEDVIRVADLKTRRKRFERVRVETGAKPHEPVRITEFLKPGIDELVTVLPMWLGRRVSAWVRHRSLEARLHVPLHIRTDTIAGYALLRMMARLKGRRRKGLRFQHEQASIVRWLDGIEAAATRSSSLAMEWAECGRLIKGYSDTRQRANRNFDLLYATVLEPALAGRLEPAAGARWLSQARDAALADEDGKELARVLAAPPDASSTPENRDTVQAAE